ncbi:hypothetical protein ABPG74_018980 [Tetrahymena malaccensis]
MDNNIIAQTTKSKELFKQELQTNSQSSSISIQFQQIKQEGLGYLEILAEHLQKYQHYSNIFIKISKNVILGDEGYQKLAQSLKILAHAQILKLQLEEQCQIESSRLLFLTKVIASLKQISDLSIIIDQYNYIQNEGLGYLASIFEGLLNLNQLQIQIGQQNRYDQTGIIFFCNKLKLVQNLKKLQLDIDGSKINENGVKAIANALENFKNLQVLNFKYHFGQVQNEGAIQLAVALGSLVNLTELDLSIFKESRVCSQIQIEFANNLKNLKKLESLQIEGLYYLNDKLVIIRFAEVFEQMLQLKYLNLKINSSKKCGKYAAQCLGNSLKSLVNLNDFQLIINSNCNIGAEGSSALAQAIKNMKQLIKLQINIDNDNQIGCEGAASIGEALKELQQIQYLSLTVGKQNSINSKGAQAIAEAIQQLSNLIELQVHIEGNNYIQQTGLSSFGHSLLQLNNLQVLKYNFVESFSNYGVLGLAHGFQSLSKLKQLQLSFSKIENISEQNQKIFFESFKYLINLENFSFQIQNNNDFTFAESYLNLSYVSQALSHLKNLIQLNLCINIQKNQNYIEFGNALSCFKKLIKLKINVNEQQQGTKYFEAVANGIQNLVYIQELQLYVRGQYLNQDFSQKCEDMFKNLVNLRQLYLQIQICLEDNYVFQEISQSFKYLTNLESLTLNMNVKYSKNTSHNQEIILLGNGLTYLVNLQQLTLIIFLPSRNNLNIDIIVKEIKSLKKLEKFKGYINSNYDESVNLLNYLECCENVQELDLNVDSTNLFYGSYNQQVSDHILKEDQAIEIENYVEKQLQIEDRKESYQNLTSLKTKFKLINNHNQGEMRDKFLTNIKQYKNINRLDLNIVSKNLFSSFQSNLISQSLINLQKLNHLTLIFQKNNGFGTHSAGLLGNSFKSLIHLEYLNLQIGNFNYIKEEGARALAKGIESLVNLTQFILLLGGCAIQKKGAIQIGNCLQYLTNLKNLSLEIGQDKIENEGAAVIGRGIKHLSNLNELKISIGDSNQIKQEGASALGEGMQNLVSLTKLDLSISNYNDIHSSGISSVCRAITKMNYLQQLNLNFGHNNQIKSVTIQELSQAIKYLENLIFFEIEIHLSVINQSFNFEIEDLIRSLNSSQVIFVYNNERNTFKNKIESNSSDNFDLKSKITIAKDGILCEQEKQEKIFLPIQSIPLIPQIKVLEINLQDGFHLEINGCSNLADSIQYLQSIEDLSISFNNQQIETGIEDIANSISKLSNLKHLSLKLKGQNGIFGTSIQQIGNYFQKLNSLEKFQFSIEKQNDLVLSDLLGFIRSLTALEKLKFVNIQHDLDQNNEGQNQLLNLLIRKIRRLVLCEISHESYNFQQFF